MWCGGQVEAEKAGETSRLINFEGSDIINDYKSSFEERHRCVTSLIQTRRMLLDRQVNSNSIDLTGGKILRYEIDNTDSCGFSPSESNNYIDVDDMPGWDTWFHFYRHSQYGDCILCWVPPIFISLAQSAIELNPVDCICFVDLEAELSA